MPLEAAIGQILAPYSPGSHQGNRQINNGDKIHPLKKSSIGGKRYLDYL